MDRMMPLLLIGFLAEHRPVESLGIPDTPVRMTHSAASFVPEEYFS
jgi:hypothetical protein